MIINIFRRAYYYLSVINSELPPINMADRVGSTFPYFVCGLPIISDPRVPLLHTVGGSTVDTGRCTVHGVERE